MKITNYTSTLCHCIGPSLLFQVLGKAGKSLHYSLCKVAVVILLSDYSYGDILPNTSEEKWVATICMLWGVVLFGYILGGLASLLTNSDAQRSRYIHRLNTIRDHLKEAGVSEPLKRKVLGYYEYLVIILILTLGFQW